MRRVCIVKSRVTFVSDQILNRTAQVLITWVLIIYLLCQGFPYRNWVLFIWLLNSGIMKTKLRKVCLYIPKTRSSSRKTHFDPCLQPIQRHHILIGQWHVVVGDINKVLIQNGNAQFFLFLLQIANGDKPHQWVALTRQPIGAKIDNYIFA